MMFIFFCARSACELFRNL